MARFQERFLRKESDSYLQEVVDGLTDLGLCEAALGELVNSGVLSCVKPKGMSLCEHGWPDLLGGRPSGGGGSDVEDGGDRGITGSDVEDGEDRGRERAHVVAPGRRWICHRAIGSVPVGAPAAGATARGDVTRTRSRRPGREGSRL
jgi:hypothetical protein